MNYLTTAATLKCCHGGTVKIPAGMTRVRIDGTEVVAREALIGAPILGCPNVGPGLVPCTAVVSVLAGASPGVRVGGVTPLVKPATGMTNGSPPGVWYVESAGQKKVSEGVGGGGAGAAAATSPGPAAGPAAPAAGPRTLKWEPAEAKVGEKVAATWSVTPADGGSAWVTILEHLPDGKDRRVDEGHASWPAGSTTARLRWKVTYPPAGPPKPRHPYAELFFRVTTAAGTFESKRDDGSLLKVRADLRCRVTDPEGRPLANQECRVFPLGSAPRPPVRTDADGLMCVANIHPGAPGLFLSGRAGQLILTAEEGGADRKVCRVPDYARAEAVLALAARRLEAAPPDLAHAQKVVEQTREAVRQEREERDKWAMTKQAAANAILITSILLADDITVVGELDDVAIPVIWSQVLGTAIVNAVIVLAFLPWESGETKKRTEELKKTVTTPPPAPRPAPPAIPAPVPLARPRSEDDESPAVELFWPAYYLPPPRGWFPGLYVQRSQVPAREKRGSATCQKQVNTLIRFAAHLAARTGGSVTLGELYPNRPAPQLVKAVLDAKRRPQAWFNSPTHDRLKADVKALEPEAFQVRRRSVPADEESAALATAGGGLTVWFDAHHVLPLYFDGGTDSFENLCVLDADAHATGHYLLRYQPHWAGHGLKRDITTHPAGTMYRVEFTYRPSNRTFGLDDMGPDPEEPDYQHRGEGPR
jgi:hypothetical protein